MTAWRKSTFCGPSNGCIEIQEFMSGDGILVRDSKDPDGPRLAFTRVRFARLLNALKVTADG